VTRFHNDGPFSSFSQEFACYSRIALYSGFYEIHKAGVTIPDYAAGGKVTRNALGQFRIVGFADAEPGHVCRGHERCEELKSMRRDFKLGKHLVSIDCLGHWVYDADMHWRAVLPCSKDRIPTREELSKGLRLF
jgi:hypothetical protein